VTEQETLQRAAVRLGLSVTAKFVPFSQSRNREQKDCILNWKVTLQRNGRDIMTTDYSAGQGHCHSYKNPPKFENGTIDKYLQRKRIADECENGKTSRLTEHGSRFHVGGAAILPDECDVIYSLVLDSDVLNYSGFEQWADNFGYDSDSRAAMAIYQDCLDIALVVKQAFIAQEWESLEAACQDY
jgi:hypothetical protein